MCDVHVVVHGLVTVRSGVVQVFGGRAGVMHAIILYTCVMQACVLLICFVYLCDASIQSIVSLLECKS